MRLPAKAGLHDEIIRASDQIGSESGEEGLTMRAIASRLGMSSTGLYQHFENKASILREVRFYGVRMLRAALQEASADDDAAVRMRAMCHAYVRFADANPFLYTSLFEQPELDWTTMPPEELAEALAPMELTRRTFAAGVAQGTFSSALEVDDAVLVTWASLHGVVSLIMRRRVSEAHPAYRIPSLDAFVELFIDTLLRGYTREPTA